MTFNLYDGAQERPIVTFSRQDAPLSVGLVFDCSRSMRDNFQTSRLAASQLFDQLDPDQDEAFLVTVSDRVVLRQESVILEVRCRSCGRMEQLHFSTA